MNNRSIFVFILFLNSLLCIAQSKKKYDPQSYRTEYDSLLTQKNKSSNSKQELLSEIDKLKKQSSDLSDKIFAINLEIEKLYTDKFGKEFGSRIYNKQIWKGMTEKMLLASWGNPDKIEKNVEKWGTFTQWYYGNITFFFRNSKLIDWEELK